MNLGKRIFIFWVLLFFSTFLATYANAYSGRVGTYFFHWYRCPDAINPDPHTPGGNACDPSKIDNHGVGMTAPYPEGGYYHWDNVNFYRREFADMVSSGITDVFPVDFYYDNQVYRMIDAIRGQNLPLKIGFFWDPPAEYEGKFDLRNSADRKKLYDDYIKRHFKLIPRELWSTIGPAKQPIIFTVYVEKERNLSYSLNMFDEFKSYFKRDFSGTEPFIVAENSWFSTNGRVKEVVDGKYTWGGAMGLKIDDLAKPRIGKFRVSGVGPGIDMRKTPWAGASPLYVDRENGDKFRRELSGVPYDTNILMIETWNELFENTGISRAVDYKDGSGKPMSDITYMRILQQYLGRPNLTVPTVTPPSPVVTSALCDGENCRFLWTSLANVYGDNIKYIYKIFSDSLSGNETYCPSDSIQGGGCWRGNTETTLARDLIINASSYSNNCPNGRCIIRVWSRDGYGNISQVARQEFNTRLNCLQDGTSCLTLPITPVPGGLPHCGQCCNGMYPTSPTTGMCGQRPTNP